MFCHQCKSQKSINEFMKKNKQFKNCTNCRNKGTRSRSKNKETSQLQTQHWKAHNKEYIKLMNEFYRKTNSLSEEDRTLLKNMIKFPNSNQSHYSKDDVVGKNCNLPKCGWKPLNQFYPNESTADNLSNNCIRCFHIRTMIRSIICSEIRRKLVKFVKSGITDNIIHPYIGCTMNHYKLYLETLFTNDMSWDNFENIHIDHIFPVCSFDLTEPRELFLCFHYKNCQPLWGLHNMTKKNTYNEEKKQQYIEDMKTQTCDNDVFLNLLHRVETCIDKKMNNLIQKNDELKYQKQKELYKDYLHDQCLEAIQIMFFMYENNIHEKSYQSTPFFLMRNKDSRKHGLDNIRSKRVYKLSMDGSLLGVYDSMNMAAIENKTFHASVSKCCSNPDRLFASGGFRWCFEHNLDTVQHRARFSLVLKQLSTKIKRYHEPKKKQPIPPMSDEIKKKIAISVKRYNETDEGRQKKRTAFQKRADTMKARSSS